MILRGRSLVAGRARGIAVVLGQPLSLWGGMDPATGRVIDQRHPRAGTDLAGRVLVMPAGRGSSSSSSVLAEAIRAGTAPAAIVLAEADPILALGAVVAQELYGRTCPVVVLAPSDHLRVGDGDELTIDGGRIRVRRPRDPAAPAGSYSSPR